MGASSSSSSSSSCPEWYPGEPSVDLLSESHYHGYLGGESPSLSSSSSDSTTQRPFENGRRIDGDGRRTEERALSTTEEGGTASSSTTKPATTGSPSSATLPQLIANVARSTVIAASAVPPPASAAAAAAAAQEGGRTAAGYGLERGTRPMNTDETKTTSTKATGETPEETKKAKRDITSLPVVELKGMKYIAKGTYCAVFACEYRGFSVVAKRVRHDLPLHGRQQALENLWEEFDCLSRLHHLNVIEAYGMCRVRCREGYEDWNEKDVCLLLEELAFGTVGHLFGTIYNFDKNLASALARSRKMKMVPFRCRLDRTLELAQALEYVHGGSGIGPMMHRDIKSMNVGFARNGTLKLLDFGLAKRAPIGGEENGTYKMTGEVGSYRYMAPELVRHEPYNSKVDIYSWAILSWEILAIDKPYGWATQGTFVTRVVAGGERPELPKAWPAGLRKLLATAWHPDHTKRPAASDLVAALRTIKAELPAKYQRQRPSLTAGAGPPTSGRSTRGEDRGGGGAAAAAAAENSQRRHTWDSGAVGRRPSSARRAAIGRVGRGGGGVVPVAAPAVALRPTVSAPLPPPLAPSSFSSNSSSPSPASSSEKPKRWYSVGRRPSWLASSAQAGGAEPGGGGGARGRAASARQSQSDAGPEWNRRRNSASGPTAGGVIGVFVGDDSEDRNDSGVRQQAAGWGEKGEDRRSSTIDDDGRERRRGRRPPTIRRRISRRRASIVEALARETEGLSTKRAQQSGPGACAVAEAAPESLHTTTRASQRASTDVARVVHGGSWDNDRQRRRNGDRHTREEGRASHAADALLAAAPGMAREKKSNDVGRPPRVLSRDDSQTPTSSFAKRASDRGPLARTTSLATQRQDNTTASGKTLIDGVGGGGGGRKRSGSGRPGGNEVGCFPSLRPESCSAPKDREPEDVKDVSGRSSREMSRGGGGLGEIWPSSTNLPTTPSSSSRGLPEEKNNRRGAVSSVSAPGTAAENEVNIFAVLGAPSGVTGAAAEGIERRLAVVRGKLAMPRGVSPRARSQNK